MKPHDKKTWLLFCLLVIGLQACSLPLGTSKEDFAVADRTKPASAPWKYTRTPDLSLTATNQYLATETQAALEAGETRQAQAAATSTALDIQSTATAAARESVIESYAYFEPFDQNTYDWRVGAEDNQFWQGSIGIQDGTYTWRIAAVKEPFVTWSDFTPTQDLDDFDVALKVRRQLGEPHAACYGLLFRVSPSGFDYGTYTLSMCDNGYFKVLYYDAENSWEVLEDWTLTEAIRRDDWNLLEINARGDKFTIFINHLPVLTFNDSRLASGGISILIDQYSEEPSDITIDFFALQP